MYECSDLRFQWYSAHRELLVQEATRERLVRRAGLNTSLECRICLQLGRALISLGQRLEQRGRRGAGSWTPMRA
jgi:hypothetical protein